jgi:hypothetical protein
MTVYVVCVCVCTRARARPLYIPSLPPLLLNLPQALPPSSPTLPPAGGAGDFGPQRQLNLNPRPQRQLNLNPKCVLQTLGLATLGPNGKANPMSDFTDGPPYSGREAEYTNQVCV